MTAVWLTLLIPLFGIGVMALIGHTRAAGWVNVVLSAMSFGVSVWLALIVYAVDVARMHTSCCHHCIGTNGSKHQKA